MQERIHGTTMPVLEVRLEPGDKLVAESGELSWLTDSIELSTNTGGGGLTGLVKRAVGGGGSLFMTQYTANGRPGTVAFAAKLPGAIVPQEIGGAASGWIGHRHAFLCGTDGVQLDWFLQRRLGAGLFGGSGFCLQRVTGEGTAWFELSGEVVTYDLQPGQRLRVHPGHIGLFQDTVDFQLTTVPGIANKFFGGDGLFLAQLTGPGRVLLQTLTLSRLAAALAEYLPHDTASATGAATSSLGGALAATAVNDVVNDVFGGNGLFANNGLFGNNG